MKRVKVAGTAVALAAFVAARSASADTTLDLSGEVPDDPYRHFSIPFEVMAGTREIAVHQESLSEGNTLDFGIADPSGAWRGWGGSRLQDVVIGEQAATRSHVPGPIATGTWEIVVGKAAVNETPAAFSLQVMLREAPTLAPQTDRKPYETPAPLTTEARWYAGDFHVHSQESNDAKATLDDIGTFAKGRGLDFVHISDHNIHTQLDYLVDAQAAHPDLLFLPGAEYTTYWGHASAIGAMSWVDDRTELPLHGIVSAVEQYHAQGALFSINHPTIAVGDACIGCAWEHELPADHIDGVEIGTGKFGLLSDSAVQFWDALCAQGRHVPALGGSDDHSAGTSTSATASAIGSPTTMVFASELSVAAIMDAIRAGRTVVKLDGPTDPMAEIASSRAPEGDTIPGGTRLTATVTGGVGYAVRWVKNGEAQPKVDVDTDPFVLAADVSPPASGEDRWRAEVLQSAQLRTVTSHVWIGPGPALPSADDGESDARAGGCGCMVGRRPSLDGLIAMAVVALSAIALRFTPRSARRAARQHEQRDRRRRRPQRNESRRGHHAAWAVEGQVFQSADPGYRQR